MKINKVLLYSLILISNSSFCMQKKAIYAKNTHQIRKKTNKKEKNKVYKTFYKSLTLHKSFSNGSISSLNTYDKNGETPLTLACKWGNYQIAHDLLLCGAHPSYPNKNGILPITCAINSEYPESGKIIPQLAEKTFELKKTSPKNKQKTTLNNRHKKSTILECMNLACENKELKNSKKKQILKQLIKYNLNTTFVENIKKSNGNWSDVEWIIKSDLFKKKDIEWESITKEVQSRFFDQNLEGALCGTLIVLFSTNQIKKAQHVLMESPPIRKIEISEMKKAIKKTNQVNKDSNVTKKMQILDSYGNNILLTRAKIMGNKENIRKYRTKVGNNILEFKNKNLLTLLYYNEDLPEKTK